MGWDSVGGEMVKGLIGEVGSSVFLFFFNLLQSVGVGMGLTVEEKAGA